MVDESGDHPKDVEHSSPAANNISSSTLTAAFSSPCKPEDSDDDLDWSWSDTFSEPEDLPKGVPCDSDSDDEYENSKEYAEKFAEYTRQVKESEGFDIEEYVFPGMLEPIPYFKENKEDYAMVKEMALEALKTFNDDHGKEYELVDVEKVVWTSNLYFYLTIKAKQLHAKDDDVKTIQAIVLFEFREKHSIKLCRLKPDKLKK